MSAFASLGSGSRGNAALVRLGETLLLVDCGFSLRQTQMRLQRLDVRPEEIDAILVTHEHSDHVSGVAALATRYRIPVWATHGTFQCRALEGFDAELVGGVVHGDCAFDVRGIDVMPVTVPHDAREPVQFVFDHGGTRIGVVSDLGCVTPHVADCYQGCDGLMLESNHDLPMLQRGPYPAHLKRRIASDLGHLSNDQAAGFLAAVANDRLRVVIGHVSESNNHPHCLEKTFANWPERIGSLCYATQRHGAAWTTLRSSGKPTQGTRPAVQPALQFGAGAGAESHSLPALD